MCGHQSASKTMIELHIRQHNGEIHFCNKCEHKTGDLNLLNMTSLPPPNSLGLPPHSSSSGKHFNETNVSAKRNTAQAKSKPPPKLVKLHWRPIPPHCLRSTMWKDLP